MPKIGFGFMGSYSAAKGLTPFERFYLGGNALTGVARLDGRELISLRGYEEQEVSSNLGDPIITRYSLELRYPISLNLLLLSSFLHLPKLEILIQHLLSLTHSMLNEA